MTQEDMIELDDSIELDLTAGYQTIRATIRSREPVTLDNLDQLTDAITYSLGHSVKFDGFYYTVVIMEVDQEAAEAFQNEYMETEAEEDKVAWTGDIWDWLDDGPAFRMNEDGVLPEGCSHLEDVEIEFWR